MSGEADRDLSLCRCEARRCFSGGVSLSRAVAKQGTASVEDLSSWLFVSIVFIFVLFSASRSRRLYYILPAVPWCVLFTAAWFSEPAESWSFLRKLTDKFFRLVDMLIPWAAGLLILLSIAGIAVSCIERIEREIFGSVQAMRSMNDKGGILLFDQRAIDRKTILLTLMPFALIAGIAWLIVWRRSRKQLLREGGEGAFAASADPLNRTVPFVAVTMFAVFALVIPVLSSTTTFEPTAPFLRKQGDALKNYQAAIPGFFPERTAFFGDFGGSELTYYMDLQKPIPQFWLEGRDAASRTFFEDTTEVFGLDEFRAFLNTIREQGGAVITRGDCLDDLKDAEGGKELYDMLNDERVFVIVKSDLNLFQEQQLKSLRAKPGSRDNPKLMKKIRKLEGKRVNIFYHIPESIAQPAEPDGTEGTPQS